MSNLSRHWSKPCYPIKRKNEEYSEKTLDAFPKNAILCIYTQETVYLPAGTIDARSAEQRVRHFFCKAPAGCQASTGCHTAIGGFGVLLMP